SGRRSDMLSAEKNELLTHVEPGTPMGTMLRRYWIPALLSEELPEPDSGPKAFRLLGENLVAFRDTLGRVGILHAHCPHRGAALRLARNEECGLRCLYHGWKMDVNGNVLETPNEPEGSALQGKVKAKSYLAREGGGVIWAYMGPVELVPPFPAFEWTSI